MQEVVRFLRNKLNDNYEIVTDYQSVLNERFDIALLRNRDIIALHCCPLKNRYSSLK